MFDELKDIPRAWNKALRSRSFRNQLIISMLVMTAGSFYNFHYLREWQARQGIEINDYVLIFLQPHDFSVPIFFIEYCTILLVIAFTLPYPDRFVKGLQILTITILARTWCVYLLPLEPPKDMLFLHDPLADLLLHSRTVLVTKDLFFSGHISVLSVLVLISSNKYVKCIAIVATVLVGVMIIWQHVHYSIDILFAPIVAFFSYNIVLFAHKESRYGLNLHRNNQSIETGEPEVN